MVLSKISGAELKALPEEYFTYLFSGPVQKDVDSALDRIESVFGNRASKDGRNITGIITIRNILSDLCKTKDVAGGFLITAPHSHWPIAKRIIIHFDNNRYLIGPIEINLNSFYRPVSFVFSPDGPMPYEWADESVAIEDSALELAYKIVESLNAQVWKEQWPLGISLNYRFKELFSAVTMPTIEAPTEDEVNAETLGQITPTTYFYEETGVSDVEQVAWHALSDQYYNLNDNSLECLMVARQIVERLHTTQEREAWVNDLAQVLRSDRQSD